MSDEGDKTCPLCAEEMDLTDQQLKPCKCGYEICVWCWHHIMDMAEKDHIEGRCPACRAPYNKERIVGMTSNCGKLIGGMSVVKKKSQKGKNRTSEDRKQLGNLRVIQRNLVYIVGLPLNLADDDLLESKEYFSQYGKVQKVSISRTAAGCIQQNPNGTCNVYITYSKEEEAVRCIQAVHGFVLEGRPLKACFGTTKYCHAFLRNVPCSNPDCLYLHDIGSPEDSYTKDEIITAYTRVHQIMGITNSTQGRMGNVLPPPRDDYCNNSSASTIEVSNKNATTDPASNIRGPPNSSSGRSGGLPAGALWGTRASNNLRTASSTCNGTINHNPGNCTVTFSAAVANQNQFDVVKKHLHNGEVDVNRDRNRAETAESVNNNLEVDRQTTAMTIVAVEHLASSSVNIQLPSEVNKRCVSSPKNGTSPDEKSCRLSLGKDSYNTRVKVHNLCSDISLMNINEHEGLLSKDSQFSESITSYRDEKTATSGVSTSLLNEKSDHSLLSGLRKSQLASHDIEDDIVAFNNQRLKDPELVADRVYKQNLTQSFHFSNYSNDNLNRAFTSSLSLGVNFHPVNDIIDTAVTPSEMPVLPTGYTENQVNQYDALDMKVDQFSDYKSKHMEILPSASGSRNAIADIGENSIISDILSLDFDPWEEPLASHRNLTKILRDSDHQQGSLLSSFPRAHSSSQSRFSFAREGHISQTPYMDPSSNYVGNTTQSGHFSHEYLSSNNISVSRSQVSAPPRFSPSNRAPPPGFTSQERVEQSFDPFAGSQPLDSSLRNQYQASMAGNMVSSGDIELMDPAILAVGKGRLPVGLNTSGLDTRQNFSSQYGTYENEVRLQLLMERSLHPQQNHIYSDMGNNFTHLQDALGIPPRVMEQTFTEHPSPFSQMNSPNFKSSVSTNGHWEGWNEVHSGNQFAMAELLRNESLGFNNYHAGNEESLFRIPSSGDVYAYDSVTTHPL